MKKISYKKKAHPYDDIPGLKYNPTPSQGGSGVPSINKRIKIGITNYTIKAQLDTDTPHNLLSVDFVIWDLATEPKDYQLIIDQLQLLCKKFWGRSYIMTCAHCEKEFVPRRHSQKYCCPQCQREDIKKKRRENSASKVANKGDIKYQPVCYSCGRTFEPKFYHEHFCSDECRFASPFYKGTIEARLFSSLNGIKFAWNHT